ncbi:MAG: acyltransferase [Oscillospiraceae bacterium]|nr:acyltransferase [Oscillospiraceae bacterium]
MDLQTRPLNGNTPSKAKQRYVGIDLVKIVACFLVVCVHFFLYSGFYGQVDINNDFGQAPIVFRWVAYCCVPLFMITTGYLMKNKTMSKKYYLGIIRVLVIYLICTVICYAFDHHHYPLKYQNYGGYSVWIFLRGLLMFSGAQYGWYVEYYLCIFMIIPFINLAFNSLKNQKQKQIMLITTIMLTIVSQSFYVGFDFDPTYNPQIKMFPGYFTRCYPIAYYLIGAYIREFPPKRTLINKLYFMGMYALGLAWISITTFQHTVQSKPNEQGFHIFYSRHYNDYGSWPVALCSTMLFLILFDIRSKNPILIQIIKFISEATFACYLISYIFDTMFYSPDSTFGKKYHTVPERWSHAYTVIPKIFLASMGIALLIQAVYTLGDWVVRKVIIPAARKADYDPLIAGSADSEQVPYPDAAVSPSPASYQNNAPEQTAQRYSPKHVQPDTIERDADNQFKELYLSGALTKEEYEQLSKDMTAGDDPE